MMSDMDHIDTTAEPRVAEYSLQEAGGVEPRPTDAEQWKYNYLNQLVINAKMRLDMYAAEATRAKRDILTAEAELTAHIKNMRTKYGDDFSAAQLEGQLARK